MESPEDLTYKLETAIRSNMAGGNPEAIRNATSPFQNEEEEKTNKKLPQDYLKRDKTILDVLKLVKNKRLQRNQIKIGIRKLLKNEEDLNDFLRSILNVVGHNYKKETKEATVSGGGVGAYSQSPFSEDSKKVEAKEALTTSSSGQYSQPKIWAKSTSKKHWRGKSDKFRVMPGAKFVKVKSKCKKFPYCNQGDINALELFENDTVSKTINKISKDMNLHEDIIKEIIYNEIVKRQSK